MTSTISPLEALRAEAMLTRARTLLADVDQRTNAFLGDARSVLTRPLLADPESAPTCLYLRIRADADATLAMQQPSPVEALTQASAAHCAFLAAAEHAISQAHQGIYPQIGQLEHVDIRRLAEAHASLEIALIGGQDAPQHRARARVLVAATDLVIPELLRPIWAYATSPGRSIPTAAS